MSCELPLQHVCKNKDVVYFHIAQTLAQLLCEMREANKSLQFEVDDLKQKLKDAQGDIKVQPVFVV